MADTLTDSFSSIIGLPDRLHSKYVALDISCTTRLPPRRDRESNSEAIIKALKALQEKLRQLELEKDLTSRKFEHLKDLSQDAGLFSLATPPTGTRPLPQFPKRSPANKSTQLTSRHKCELISERDAGVLSPTPPPTGTRPLPQFPKSSSANKSTQVTSRQKCELISERDAGVLSPTPPPIGTRPLPQFPKSSSANKSTQVTSRHKCELISERDAGVLSPTPLPIGPKLLQQFPLRSSSNKPASISRRHKCTSASSPAAVATTSGVARGKIDHHLSVGCGKHYHLNYKDLPFIIGVSATPSHSLFANYQHMLHLLKCHGPMCRLLPCNYEHLVDPSNKQYETLVELSALLTNLQDEVRKLSSGYQHLSPKRNQCEDRLTRKEHHQLKTTTNKLRSKSNEMAEFCRQSVSSRAECPVCACICDMHINDTSALQQQRQLLKTFKQVQKTLQSDDLHWQ